MIFKWKYAVYRQMRQGRMRMAADCIVGTKTENTQEAHDLALSLIWQESDYRNQELVLIDKQQL